MTSDLPDDALFEADEAVQAAPREIAPAGRDKVFRSYEQGQAFLLPPSLDDWLPVDHVARFVSEVVDEMLDLEPVYRAYKKADGAPPYDPRMMLKLLLYGYSTGVTSSREIERRCSVDVAFRWLAANQCPDYRSVARFRRQHLAAVEALHVQVLQLCAKAGLVKLGRVALDGTKVRASASRHKAMSYDHMGPKLKDLQRQVRELLAEAEATDRAEDAEYGEDRRGDELPAELARRETRIAKLKAAKKAIEEDARRKAQDKAESEARAAGTSADEVAEMGRQAATCAEPRPKEQRSFTDPEARMMKTSDGFHYAYNAQTVVDEASQVVIAISVGQAATDVQQLLPTMEAARGKLKEAGIEGEPRVWLADAGYCSDANLAAVAGNVLIATGRLKHGEVVPAAPRGRIPNGTSLRERMARKLRTKPGRADYARRKAIVEPAFGQMKVRQRAGHLRLRGLAGATGEWGLHALCHNLRKLQKAGPVPMVAAQ
jgi:transposase